jgi:hypothetical protein
VPHTIELPLYQLAHGRAGDKGNTSNISVIAWESKCFALLNDNPPLRLEVTQPVLDVAEMAHLRSIGYPWFGPSPKPVRTAERSNAWRELG